MQVLHMQPRCGDTHQYVPAGSASGCRFQNCCRCPTTAVMWAAETSGRSKYVVAAPSMCFLDICRHHHIVHVASSPHQAAQQHGTISCLRWLTCMMLLGKSPYPAKRFLLLHCVCCTVDGCLQQLNLHLQALKLRRGDSTSPCSREGPIRSANSLKGHSHSALSNALKMRCSDPSTWMRNHVTLPPMHWPLKTAALWKHCHQVSQHTSCSPLEKTQHSLTMARPSHDLVLWTCPSKLSMPWPTDTAWGIRLWALPAAVSEAGCHLSA